MIAYEVTNPAAGTVTQEITQHMGQGKTKSYVGVQSNLLTPAGGTSIKVYLQTSFDDGVTWWDVACHAFLVAALVKASALSNAVAAAVRTAAVDGTLADDTIFNGFFGLRWRLKVVTVGNYTGTSVFRVNINWKD